MTGPVPAGTPAKGTGGVALPSIGKRTRRNAATATPLWESTMMPPTLTHAVKDLLKQLLQPEPEHRLGSRADDFDRLMGHAWFAGLDWDLLAQRKLPAPWLPDADTMAIKASHHPSMPIYETADPRVDGITLSAGDQLAWANIEYCSEYAVRREVIANMHGRNHHNILQKLYKAKSISAADATVAASKDANPAPPVANAASSAIAAGSSGDGKQCAIM